MYDQVPIVLMYYGGSWGLFPTKNFTGWPSDEATRTPCRRRYNNDDPRWSSRHLQQA